jgi:hypothetical protein
MAKAGDPARLLDGKGGVVEWKIPFDGEHETRFPASPEAMFYRLELRRRLVPVVELLVAIPNPVFIESARVDG